MSFEVAILTAQTGRALTVLHANGFVAAAIADRRGGWFVAGSFTRIGGRREIALAHLLPNGRVDPRWRARVGSASGRPVAVNALALGNHRLYVAGAFGRLGGLSRPGLGAVAAGSGAVDRSWRLSPRLCPDVQSMLVVGSRLLVAGSCLYPRPGIVAFDAVSGRFDRGWDARLRVIGDAGAFNVLRRLNGIVYAAGAFHVTGAERNGLAAFAISNGSLDRGFAPKPGDCVGCRRGLDSLSALAVSNTGVYVGGSFRRIDGVPRLALAALDPRTGAIDDRWRARRDASTVLRLELAGGRLYVGRLDGLSALDPTSGRTLAHPRQLAPGPISILSRSNGHLLVSGLR